MNQFPCERAGILNTSFILRGGNRLFARLAVCLAFSSVCVSAAADEIVVEGARYRDVLVLKTTSNYYVQIPWEGRTISVRAEKVDESTVSINEDPFYRDELKEEYRQAKELRDAGKLSEPAAVDPMFGVQAQSPSAGFGLYEDGGSAGGGGRTTGAGLGMARSQAESMLANMGMQFRAGPGRNGMPSVVAQMPTGGSIELIGPPNRLMGLEVTVTVPAAQVTSAASQMQILVMQSAPEAASQFQAMLQEAQQSGQSQRTIDGVSTTITIRESGEMAEFKISVMALN